MATDDLIARLLDATDLRRPATAGIGAPANPTHRFLSSGDVGWFADLGRRLLGPELAAADHIDFSDRQGR